MKFDIYRCSSGYVLTPEGLSNPEGAHDQGPLDYIGQFKGDSLTQDVYRRVVDEIARRAYAVISKSELGLA